MDGCVHGQNVYPGGQTHGGGRAERKGKEGTWSPEEGPGEKDGANSAVLSQQLCVVSEHPCAEGCFSSLLY